MYIEELIKNINAENEALINNLLIMGYGSEKLLDMLEGNKIKNIIISTDGITVIFKNGDVRVNGKRLELVKE